MGETAFLKDLPCEMLVFRGRGDHETLRKAIPKEVKKQTPKKTRKSSENDPQNWTENSIKSGPKMEPEKGPRTQNWPGRPFIRILEGLPAPSEAPAAYIPTSFEHSKPSLREYYVFTPFSATCQEEKAENGDSSGGLAPRCSLGPLSFALSWASLGLSGAPLGLSWLLWGSLGLSLALLGPSWLPPGSLLASLGPLLGGSWPPLGGSWASLGPPF